MSILDLDTRGDPDKDVLAMFSDHERQHPSSEIGNSNNGATGIKYPGKHDVMLGRGGESNYHSGNLAFRLFVDSFKEVYQTARRPKKPEMAMEVVYAWRRLDPPGRFLARTHPDRVDSLWHEVGDKLACKRAAKNLGERKSHTQRHRLPSKSTKAKQQKPPTSRKVVIDSHVSMDTPSTSADGNSSSEGYASASFSASTDAHMPLGSTIGGQNQTDLVDASHRHDVASVWDSQPPQIRSTAQSSQYTPLPYDPTAQLLTRNMQSSHAPEARARDPQSARAVHSNGSPTMYSTPTAESLARLPHTNQAAVLLNGIMNHLPTAASLVADTFTCSDCSTDRSGDCFSLDSGNQCGKRCLPE